MIETIVAAVLAVVGRSILRIPETARKHFHSKLDKRDTRDGWRTVAEDARGVPYSAVVIATQGRTYSLATLHHLLDIPDIDSLRGTAS